MQIVPATMNQMELTFLLPNGFTVKMPCDKTASLDQLRAPLWKKAVQLPAANLLRNPEAYVFIGVTVDAAEIEFDDGVTVDELRLIYPVLEVSEKKEQRDLRRLYMSVAEATGTHAHQLDSLKSEEFQMLRKCLKEMCGRTVKTREGWSVAERALFHHPPILDINPDLPMSMVKQFMSWNCKMKIKVWRADHDENSSCDIEIDPTSLPSTVVATVVDHECRQRSLSNSMTSNLVSKAADQFVLKVCGKEEYLLRECCIHMYKYIRDSIGQNTTPQLMLVDRDTIYKRLPNNGCVALNQEHQKLSLSTNKSIKSSWELQNDYYTIRIGNLPVRKSDHPGLSAWTVHAQLFHGMTPISNHFSTLDVGFNQPMQFDITIQNIPRCARLCFAICATSKTGKAEHANIGVYWVNMQVFDHRGELVTGDQSLGVWRCTEGQTATGYPHGTPGGNVDRSSSLPLQFKVVNPLAGQSDVSVMFPSREVIDDTIEREEQFTEYSLGYREIDQHMIFWYVLNHQATKTLARLHRHILSVSDYGKEMAQSHTADQPSARWEDAEKTNSPALCCLNKQHEPISFQKIDEIAQIDPIRELTTDNKQFLWQNRWLAMTYAPNILSRLLQCINWSDRSAVFEFYTLLRKWPDKELTLTTVLQLLNCDSVDTRVRTMAVWCLDKQITDQLLELFLLQLIQALKFESYIHNELCRYLLYKALLNKVIGHSLFWLLRSEMEQPLSRQVFAPILEAYCCNCGEAILSKLIEEVHILNRYVDIAVTVKKQNSLGEQKSLLDALLEESDSKILHRTSSVFDQTIQLGELCSDKCKVLCSKKRPLWLTWMNRSPDAKSTDMENIHFIFKHGDDLRQDMMVLRLITAMDMIWKYACHDYKLVTYGCLAMGEETGMIEVVKNAKTVNDVRNSFNSYALNEWLHNENRDRYMEAVKTFTYSCAGYCVASFVLGLKDRHPDNIMVTKRGQVFHIDFGHITNHAKRKYGFKRERVPFVLTDDFIQVITKGSRNPTTTPEFTQFIYLCFEAYMQLRRYSGLLLSLLKLMMHSDLPELSVRADIDEVRNALAIEKSDGEATRYFLSQFDVAYGGSWTTEIDWFLHKFNMVMKKGTTS